MGNNLYSLVYCSRNQIEGDETVVTTELQNILASARANNTKANVTGALLYNSGYFAQILEGPLQHVESIFEKIQRDPRHSEVVVMHMGAAEQRLFPEWSMAFAGNSSPERLPHVAQALDAAFVERAGSGEQVVALLRDIIIQENDWVLMDSGRG